MNTITFKRPPIAFRRTKIYMRLSNMMKSTLAVSTPSIRHVINQQNPAERPLPSTLPTSIAQRPSGNSRNLTLIRSNASNTSWGGEEPDWELKPYQSELDSEDELEAALFNEVHLIQVIVFMFTLRLDYMSTYNPVFTTTIICRAVVPSFSSKMP